MVLYEQYIPTIIEVNGCKQLIKDLIFEDGQYLGEDDKWYNIDDVKSAEIIHRPKYDYELSESGELNRKEIM